MRDHYSVLGVTATATTSAIRSAYRRLALTLHPDRAGQDKAAAFREIAAAYEVLSDPERRERYDARLARERAAATPRSAPIPAASKTIIPRLSGALRSLLAAGLLRTIGEDAYEVWVSADEAASGGYISISTPPPKQYSHWITVPSGVTDGTVLPSVIRVEGVVSVVRLQIRVVGA